VAVLELAAGDVVGGYVIERRLGRGGMGAVYAAHDPGVDRRVALKVMDPLALGPDGLVRFTREAELAARVDGLGGVVRVHARGVHRGAPFLVMELIEGRDLGALLADPSQPPLGPARLAGHVEQVARALQRCHDAGVLHRDLKPANIIVRERDDAPFVADFGLARAVDSERLTLTGELLGTPAYMAPEQALDAARATSPLVDVYALGAILYHGLTGRPPRRGAGALAQLLGEDPPAPASVRSDVDRGLEAICLRAMERDPARRYASAGELAKDLARWRAGERPAPPRRRPTGALVLVAVALLLVAAALASWRSDQAHPTPAADAAAVARAIEQLVAAVPTQAVVLVDFDLEAVTARLARLDDPATNERVAALARARATPVGAPPERAPAPADALARAADAWAWWRGGDAAEALRRLGPTTARTAGLELRLRETLAPASFFVWLRERRGTPDDPWPGARPRAVARLATVLRDAATGEAPSPEALGAVDAAVSLDPTLLQDALDQAADAWRPLLGDAAQPARATSAATALRLLLRGRASASALRSELRRAFEQLALRVQTAEQGLQLQYSADLLRWDDHVAVLDPGLVPPTEYTERLIRSFFARSIFPAGLDYALACVRRGAAGADGYSLDGLAQILARADTDALASDTSAAARLCWATHLLALPDRDLAADRFEPPRLDAIIDALEAVLAAPRADLHALYAVEVRALLGDARLERAIHRGVAASNDDLTRAEAVLEEVWALGPTQDLAWIVASTRDRQLKLQGAAAADRARSQARVIPYLEAVLAGGKQEERTRRARRRLAGALWNIGVRWLEADDPTAGLASMRASFDALAPRTGWYSERDPRPRVLLDRALAHGAVDLADDFVRDHGDRACAELTFATRAIEHELARGRVERARQLLTLGRELHPDHAWTRVERWFEGR
jgi:hypothetical protein